MILFVIGLFTGAVLALCVYALVTANPKDHDDI